MSDRVHIVIAEPSLIIRSGIASVLKRLPVLDIDIAEISDLSSLSAQLSKLQPDILIIDPSSVGLLSLAQLKNEIGYSHLKTIALQNAYVDKTVLQEFDETLSLYDSISTIKEKMKSMISLKDHKGDTKQELSAREKEIVICIVKGMTNKQIAEALCLSTHTIITHRRNITNKLQIHSPAGLTIYAIVKKLVEVNDIKDSIITEE